MTTVADKQIDLATPQIHVLAIGVNAYPFLAQQQGDPNAPQLPQLTSPVPSATRLAKFLFELPPAGNLQVGTVEMAVSPAQQIDLGQGSIAVEEATLEGIARAFKAWSDRCNAQRNNVGIFYFCGHGLRVGFNTLLLPANYLELPGNVFSKAIDFSETLLAMAKIACKTQCFFIDACQTQPDGFQPAPGSRPGETLLSISASELPNVKNRCAPVIYASEFGQQAFGFADAASTPFTELLVEAIENGKCADKPTTDWVVNTVSLAGKLRQFARWKRDRGSGDFPQVPFVEYSAFKHVGSEEDSVIHILPFDPEVEARVFFPGGSALSTAAIAYAERAGARVVSVARSDWTSSLFWEVTLPAGLYGIGVEDPQDSSRNFVWPGTNIEPASAIIRRT